MNLTDLASFASIVAVLITLGTLAFSAFRYVRVCAKEQKQEDFRVYHNLIRHVSRGIDEHGSLKLVSQLAYIFELRHFPQYGELTQKLLERLRSEWTENSPNDPNNEVLAEAINDTLVNLQKQS